MIRPWRHPVIYVKKCPFVLFYIVLMCYIIFLILKVVSVNYKFSQIMRCGFINNFAQQNHLHLTRVKCFLTGRPNFAIIAHFCLLHVLLYPACTDKLDFRNNTGASKKPYKYNDYSLNHLHRCCLSLAS